LRPDERAPDTTLTGMSKEISPEPNNFDISGYDAFWFPEDRSCPTYSDDDLERIAAAVGVAPAVVKGHAAQFERAAEWYGLDRGAYEEGRRPAKPDLPYVRRKTLQAIIRSARSLLNNVGAEPQRRRRFARAGAGSQRRSE
jgi:hypothetical protein